MNKGSDVPTLKLTFELVPRTAWFSNVRSMVSKQNWDVLRKECYAQANNLCEICGGRGSQHPVEAHEVWQYDDKQKIQKLVRLIALCPSCHSVKHIGNSLLRGVEEGTLSHFQDALCHFQAVNVLTQKEATELLKDAFNIWEERNSHQWKCDVSWLDGKGIPYQPERQSKDVDTK